MNKPMAIVDRPAHSDNAPVSMKVLIRRAVMSLDKLEKRTRISGDLEAIRKQVDEFCAHRRLTVAVEPDPERTGQVVLRLVAKGVKQTPYTQIADLKVGEFVDFDVGEDNRQAQAVRRAATSFGKALDRKFTWQFVGVTTLRVMRVEGQPVTNAVDLREKYGFRRLSEQAAIHFDVPSEEHYKVRMAATSYAKRNGWAITCRADGPNRITVMRTDAAGFDAQQLPTTKTGRPSKYDFDRLETQESIYFEGFDRERTRIRTAAFATAKRRRWKVSCNIEGNGLRVTRIDPGAPCPEDPRIYETGPIKMAPPMPPRRDPAPALPPAPPTPPAPPAAPPQAAEDPDDEIPFQFTPEEIAEFERQRDLDRLAGDGWL